MSIQIQFNSVQFNYEELKAHCPELAKMIKSSLPKRKRRKRKKKKTVACLIDEIKENLEM